jgi:hypothetical protein
MSVGSIGSTSFWQQDRSYWQDAKQVDNTLAASTSIINAMASAETSMGKGLASIANQAALSRVNSQLTAAVENVLNGGTGSSASSNSASSSSTSASSSTAKPSPATGTGTAALSISTPLSRLGVLAGGTITVGAGSNTTSYTSTGTDTVGALLSAINANDYGNAAVTASLSSKGNLVITSKNNTDSIIIGGIYASNIGFAAGHQIFTPTKGSNSGSSTKSTSNSSAASSAASTKSAASSTSTTSYTTLASEMSSSAASLLSDSGVGGTLIDMLA